MLKHIICLLCLVAQTNLCTKVELVMITTIILRITRICYPHNSVLHVVKAVATTEPLVITIKVKVDVRPSCSVYVENVSEVIME